MAVGTYDPVPHPLPKCPFRKRSHIPWNVGSGFPSRDEWYHVRLINRNFRVHCTPSLQAVWGALVSATSMVGFFIMVVLLDMIWELLQSSPKWLFRKRTTTNKRIFAFRLRFFLQAPSKCANLLSGFVHSSFSDNFSQTSTFLKYKKKHFISDTFPFLFSLVKLVTLQWMDFLCSNFLYLKLETKISNFHDIITVFFLTNYRLKPVVMIDTYLLLPNYKICPGTYVNF